MSKKQETISDIVAEMRRLNPEKFLSTPWYCEPLPNKMRSYADRIEAAVKSIEADRDNWRRQALDEDARANAATIKESLTVGNAAAMRDALLEASIALSDATHHHLTEDDAKECLSVIESAIAAPPRNCDVGTVDEQSERFVKFCRHQKCNECKLRTNESFYECLLSWSKMPYEEGDAK